MGQRHGKASFLSPAKPFLNLSLIALEALWEAFNDIADGFGISKMEFCEILGELKEEMAMNTVKLKEISLALFLTVDTDKNGLVDAIEFLSSLAGCSGVSLQDALTYVFNCYDFDGSGQLTIDEIALALKSAVTGLCKLTGERPPQDPVLEALAMDAFEKCSQEEEGASDTSQPSCKRVITQRRVRMVDIVDFCMEHPEIRSWMDFFDDAPEPNPVYADVVEQDIDYNGEACFPERRPLEAAALEGSRGNAPSSSSKTSESDAAEDGKEGGKKKKTKKQDTEEPWRITVKSLVPSQYSGKLLSKDAPNTSIKLGWVYGYSGSVCKNNVRYSSDGCILYHAGRVCIRYDGNANSQRYNMDHTDDIVSFTIHPMGHLAATGEVGPSPKIVIWDALTMQTIKVIRGVHRTAVTQLAFSPDGSRLASVGQDSRNSLAVYEWETGRLIYTGPSTENKVLGCCFTESGSVVTCGIDHIYFWMKEGRFFVKHKGTFGHIGKVQAQLCVAPLGNNIVSGTASGHLYLWSGRNCSKAIRAHYGSVNALYQSPYGLVTGGKDMRVRLWTPKLAPGAVFDMSFFGPLPSVRSVCLSKDGNKLLLGVKGCEIYEVSAVDGSDVNGGAVTSGHFKGELRGLASHPDREEFATVGDDATVRIWDAINHSLLRFAKLDTPARCIDYSPDGDYLVIGLGDGTGSSPKEGGFLVMHAADFVVAFELRDSLKALTEVRWSPDNETVVMGNVDSTIFLYNAANNFESIGTGKAHQAPIRAIDFSADSDWIRTFCDGGELHFWDSTKGAHQGNIIKYKDLEWGSATCLGTWETQGLFPTTSDGSVMTAVHRSCNGDVAASGDSYGRIRVYKYPSPSADPVYHELKGHSAPVSRLRYLQGDKALVSIGGSDRCIFQWDVTGAGEAEEAAEVAVEDESEGYLLDMKDGDELERGEKHEAAVDEGEGLWPVMEAALSKEFDAEATPKTWRLATVAPTQPPPMDTAPPMDGLVLERVHGYRGRDARNNAAYAADGKAVYSAGAAAISLDLVNMQQSFQLGHTGSVSCLAVSPDGKYVATGQHGSNPLIIVWEATTCEVRAVLSGAHQRAISALAFSPDGRRLATTGCDSDHALIVYDWSNGLLQASAKCGSRKQLGVAWNEEGTRVVTCGNGSIGFWRAIDRNMSYHRGIIGAKGRLQSFPCCAFIGDTAVVGTGDGHLYAFEGGSELTRTIIAHIGPVYALQAIANEGIVSGGADGLVSTFNAQLEVLQTYDLTKLGGAAQPSTGLAKLKAMGDKGPPKAADLLSASQRSSDPCVRSVCMSSDRHRILVGTRGSELYEISTVDGSDVRGAPLTNGHGKREVWGLAVSPVDREYATVGDDCSLCIWDLDDHKLVRSITMDTSGRALCYSPDGQSIAIGAGGGGGRADESKAGTFLVLQRSDLAILNEGKDSDEWVRDIKFTPDGFKLGVACSDGQIFFYNVLDAYSKLSTCSMHQSFITRFDFSKDSQYIQSADGALALMFADVATGTNIPSASSTKDFAWGTQTVPLGWSVQGVHARLDDGSSPDCVARSWNNNLLACGDNYGRVRLFKYPAALPNAASVTFRGHSGAVRNLAWSKNDTHLITCGSDGMVCQWRRQEEPEPNDSGDEADKSGDDSEIERDGGLRITKGRPPKVMEAKPWEAAIMPPSNITLTPTTPPAVEMRLDAVHGCLSEDIRGCVRYNHQEEVIYPAAAVGVVYSGRQGEQGFHKGHKGDITCLAVSSCGRYAASGDICTVHAVASTVQVWDSSTGAPIRSFPTVHCDGVSGLAFSHDGRWLASVGHDLQHTIVIYHSPTGQWWDGVQAAWVPSGKSKVLFMLFTGETAFPLMAGGVKEVQMFGHIPGSRTLTRKKGIFGINKKIQPVLCGVWGGSDQVAVTGTVTGHLYTWTNHRLSRVTPGHSAPIYAIDRAGNSGYVTASKDGIVRLWDRSLAKLRQYSIAEIKPVSVIPHSVVSNASASKFLVATKASQVIEIGADSGRMMVMFEGHGHKQLRGIAAHPTDPDVYATVGDDCFLRVWSVQERVMKQRTRLDSAARAVAFSPDGEKLVVGLGGDPDALVKEGTLVIMCSKTLEIEQEVRNAKAQIMCLRFSLDGSLLMASTGDGEIFIHDVTKRYDLKVKTAKANGADAAITAFDLSEDKAIIQAATSDHHLLHFKVSDGSVITAKTQAKDKIFETHTIPMGWTAQGVYTHEEAGVECLGVSRSPDRTLLAAAYGDGSVKIFRYPCQEAGAESVEATGHSTEVGRVVWSSNGSYLLSIGYRSRAIIQHRKVVAEADSSAADRSQARMLAPKQ